MKIFNSLLQLKSFSKCGNLTFWISQMTTRSITTSRPTFGGIQMEKRIKSRLLDTSRNVEIDETKEVNQVALSKDGRVIVCWHPELPFPYELSKPIPTEVRPTESTLKVQALNPVREIFRKKNRGLMVQELMQLTHTAKYPWYCHRRPRMERYPKLNPSDTARDRDYL